MNVIDTSICEWLPSTFFIISPQVTGFLYYSHLLPPLVALVLTVYVLVNNHRNLASWWLVFIAVIFTVWCLFDLVVWATPVPEIVMFAWSTLIYFDVLLHIGAVYFTYVLINKHNPPWWGDGIIFILCTPIFLFAHTPFNLVAFDFTDCLRNAVEGPLWQYYVYALDILIILWITAYAFYKAPKIKDLTHKREVILSSIGIVAFLLLFSLGSILGSFNTEWELSQWGLFGMPIFIVIMAYQMLRFKTFNNKIISTDVLVTGQLILIVSLLFINNLNNIHTIVVFTFIFTLITGYIQIRTVRHEVAGRIENEQLAENLALLNIRLKNVDKLKDEFVSIASHQLRSPLTIIRTYASSILDGTFGEVPAHVREPVDHIHAASKIMASSIEDYLNVSRIESGNMKFDITDFDLKVEVERILKDMTPQVEAKGLSCDFECVLHGTGMTHADVGKTNQIILNLMSNAIKYTPAGTIFVRLHDNLETKSIFVDVIDSGVGIDSETMPKLFGKFVRAKDANKLNTQGTGLGLYVARTMALAMGGDVRAESSGNGKGSTFILNLPLKS